MEVEACAPKPHGLSTTAKAESAAYLHGSQEGHGCGIIDDPLPEHKAVQQRVAILFQHLQHSD